MVEEDNIQERTEQATEKRKRDAKTRGEVSRSREFTTMILMLTAVMIAIIIGGYMNESLQSVFKQAFSVTRTEIFNPITSYTKFIDILKIICKTLLPFLIFMFAVSVFAPMLIGGISFSALNIVPKIDRLNPIKGIQKMVSLRTLIELLKAILKFGLVGVSFYLIISLKIDEIFKLDALPLDSAISKCTSILIFGFFGMCLALIIIASVDVPFQLWSKSKRLKMTKQEVKDENKELEGRPEVKSKIRSLQREISNRRMMANVPLADVVITNPTHFAVAIKYDKENMGAPRLVAKGADLIAQMIKKVAKHNQVPELNAPALARAIFYNVELDQEVPQDLYESIAKVLAYIYELKLYKVGKIKQYPTKPTSFNIPNNLKR